MYETEHNNNAIEPRLMGPESPPIENDGPSMSAIIFGILRRWYIVIPVFILIAGIAVPAIWMLKKPVYTVQGAIKVAPILENILSGEADRGSIGTLDEFMNTQAKIITSTPVCERVADSLKDDNLKFLKEGPFDPEAFIKEKLKGVKTELTPVEILKKAIAEGIITAAPGRNTQLIMVSMQYKDPGQARKIVDAFIQAYMAVEGSASTQSQNRKLAILESEHKLLAEKIKSQRKAISDLAQEFGTKELDSRQEMKLDQVAMLLNELTNFESNVLQMEAKVGVLRKRVLLLEAQDPNDPNNTGYVPDLDDPARNEYVNSDTTVQSLTEEVALYKRMLTELSLDLQPANPELKRRKKILASLQEELDNRKEKVGKNYDAMKAKRMAWEKSQELVNSRKELAEAESALELQKAMELKFRERLANADTETIEVGRTQLDIQDQQDELALTKEQYDLITKRIQDIEMQSKQPARISVAYNADVANKADKRLKLSLASVFGGLAAGIGLAFLRVKSDNRLHKSTDVSRSIDIRVIGTTTSMSSVKKSLMPARIAEDFQTIRANISVLNGNGGVAPGKLVITSPGPGEGKTTLAINLATSMAKSGKRVLLIDGDMRSPSVASLLNLPKGTRGLQDFLFGADFQDAVCSLPSNGLDVLACDDRNSADAFELLTSPLTKQYIESIAHQYEHIIIDTPPLLAFPDAMIWAKLSDAVILSSFMGRTTTAQLKLAKERLAQVGVNLLGTILSNVPTEDGYHQYGYGGYGGYGKTVRKNEVESLLIPMHQDDDEKIENMGFK